MCLAIPGIPREDGIWKRGPLAKAFGVTGGKKQEKMEFPSLDGPLRSMIDKDVQWVKGMEWGV
jgi:hypothetical protein